MQKAIHPLRYVYVNQKENSSYSHKGQTAIDYAWRDAESQKCFAPFDCTVKQIYTPLNVVWIESNDKVLCADGTKDYVTVQLMHSFDISNLWIGKQIKQGEYFYNMGGKPNCGIHLHMGVAKGRYKSPGWYYCNNGTDNWELFNSVSCCKVLMLSDDTVLREGGGYDWKRAKDISDTIGSPVERNTKVDQVEVLVDNLRCRDNPSLNASVLGFINMGIYNVLNKQEADGYTWFNIEDNKWIAFSDGWLNIYGKEGDDPKVIEELNKQITELQNTNKQLVEDKESLSKDKVELADKINLVEKEKQELSDKNSLLNKQVEDLKTNENDKKLIFTCDKEDKYFINLKENMKLYIEK